MSHHRIDCRNCGTTLGPVFADLGMQPSANAYLSSDKDIQTERHYPLCTRVCPSCYLVQLDFDVPSDELFGDYAYFSSVSDSWLRHAEQYCGMAMSRYQLNASSLVVELASNDGYLLRNFVARGVPVLGIDPSHTVAAAAEKIGVPTLVEFFNLSLAQTLASKTGQADLIIGNNVMAHVPDPSTFIAGIAALLKPDGTINIEFPHLLNLIKHCEFDTIYHEHYSYLSLLAVEKMFARHGLRIFDVDELPTHGGSLRIYAGHQDHTVNVSDTDTLKKIRRDELDFGLAELNTYTQFATAVTECRVRFGRFLQQIKQSGQTLCGYGAAAKGNTFLNFCGISLTDIAMVADRSPHKQGKLLPGSHIPVVSPEHLLSAKPDYILILPWNLATEIQQQLSEVKKWGGRFVTAIPNIQIS